MFFSIVLPLVAAFIHVVFFLFSGRPRNRSSAQRQQHVMSWDDGTERKPHTSNLKVPPNMRHLLKHEVELISNFEMPPFAVENCADSPHRSEAYLSVSVWCTPCDPVSH